MTQQLWAPQQLCQALLWLYLHAGLAATETISREVENEAQLCLNYTFPVILERNSHAWIADWQYTMYRPCIHSWK